MHKGSQFKLGLTAMIEHCSIYSSFDPRISSLVENADDVLFVLHLFTMNSQCSETPLVQLLSSESLPHVQSDLAIPHPVHVGKPCLEDTAQNYLVH